MHIDHSLRDRVVAAALALERLEGAYEDVCSLQGYLNEIQLIGNSESSVMAWSAAYSWAQRLPPSRFRAALLDRAEAPSRLLNPCVVLGKREGLRVVAITGAPRESTGVVRDRDWRWTPGELADIRTRIALEALKEAGVPQSADRFPLRHHSRGMPRFRTENGGAVVDAMRYAIDDVRSVRDEAWDAYANSIASVGGHLPYVTRVLGIAMPWSKPGAKKFSTQDMLPKIHALDSYPSLLGAIRLHQVRTLPRLRVQMSEMGLC